MDTEHRPGGVVLELDDGLVLRWARRDDAERISEFNRRVFGDHATQEPNRWAQNWTRAMLGDRHPTMREGDAVVVEDTRNGAVASSMCLISQTWACDGIPFGVGRPELVGTHPDYRRRGLIRHMFRAFHEWGRARGHLLQAINGIPWFYRQFGYETALDLHGGRQGRPADVPAAPDGEPEPYRVRSATLDDIPALLTGHEAATADALYACVRDEAIWRHEIEGLGDEDRDHPAIIETPDGTLAGMLLHSRLRWKGVGVFMYTLLPGHSYARATPGVMRYLKAFGEAARARNPKERFDWIQWYLGESHPVYDLCGGLAPNRIPIGAWYIRVGDIPEFLRRIAPALERRLHVSPLSGHTGTLRINGFVWNAELTFENGRLAGIISCRPGHEGAGQVRFPDLTFLHVLMGRRTLEEVAYLYPDCGGDELGVALVNALFPKRPSFVLPVS